MRAILVGVARGCTFAAMDIDPRSGARPVTYVRPLLLLLLLGACGQNISEEGADSALAKRDLTPVGGAPAHPSPHAAAAHTTQRQA